MVNTSGVRVFCQGEGPEPGAHSHVAHMGQGGDSPISCLPGPTLAAHGSTISACPPRAVARVGMLFCVPVKRLFLGVCRAGDWAITASSSDVPCLSLGPVVTKRGESLAQGSGCFGQEDRWSARRDEEA